MAWVIKRLRFKHNAGHACTADLCNCSECCKKDTVHEDRDREPLIQECPTLGSTQPDAVPQMLAMTP